MNTFTKNEEGMPPSGSIGEGGKKKSLVWQCRKRLNMFLRHISGGVLASLIFLGLLGGTSVSLQGQGFLFTAQGAPSGGSYIEEIYIDELSNNFQAIPFLSSVGIVPENFGILEYLDIENDESDYIGGYLSPTNFSNVAGSNRRTIVQHTAQNGETLSYIAASFGVSVDTIKWANKITDPDLLKPGTVLDILPASGVAHIVKSGDTIAGIASKYKADTSSIIAFNALPADGQLKEGELLIIPGGMIPAPPVPIVPKVTAPKYAQNVQTSGYFIAPTTGRNFGRRHAQNGTDIANSCGTPIYAAADGIVEKVYLTSDKTRRAGGGYGNNVIIAHSNGTKTLYAHLLAGSVLVGVGDSVAKGLHIADIGGKPGTPGAGRSTGCHLHFEVRGGSNPFIRR